MALSKTLLDALNDQLNTEFYSSYLYLAMSAYLTTENMPGCAHWMRTQAHEELLHALKLQSFILDRQGQVTLATVKAPPNAWKSVMSVFEQSYEHEREITGKIHALLDMAIKENDHATANIMRWFVDEQVEEEAQIDELIHKIKMVEDSGSGMFMIDRDLASRPTPTLAE